MNSSNFMDKQITEFSSPNLQDDQEDHAFNFHPILPLQPLSKSLGAAPVGGWRSVDQIVAAKLSAERIGTSVDSELIPRIEQKLKEHADVLLQSMERFSARVSQIETRTHQVANSFDELKQAVEFNHGKVSGKLTELENVLMEVHSSLNDLRDKQAIAETQQLLAKLQAPNNKNKPETQTTAANPNLISHSEPISSHEPNRLPPSPAVFPQPVPATSSTTSNLPLPNYSQFPLPSATAPQLPSHFSQTITPSFPQQEPHNSGPFTTPGATHQPYMPLSHHSQPPPQGHQPYQPQPPQSAQPFPPANYNPEEAPHLRPPHQYLNLNALQRTYDQQSNLQDYHYNSAVRPFQSPLSAAVTGGEMGFSRLPTARDLPRAIPTASSVDDRSSSSETGKRVPIDDVIDKVVAMGFRRDLVRATVNKLTENGQHVDLNVVLDKLMNS